MPPRSAPVAPATSDKRFVMSTILLVSKPKALQKGQISAKAVEVALVRLTEKGGKYANGAIAQSDTLFGKLSTLQDALQRLGQNIGKVLAPIFKGIIDFLTTITNQINNLFQAAARNSAIDKQARQNLGLPAAGGGRLTGQQRASLRGERSRLRESGFGLSADSAAAPDLTIPALGGGAGGAGGAGSKERVDASQKLLDLNRELLGGTTKLSELEKINLEFQIAKQEILDRGLTANNEEIALLKAQAGFESDLLNFRQEQLDLQQRAADVAERERKKREADEKRRREADPGFQMKQKLEELLDVQNQVAAGATVVGTICKCIQERHHWQQVC